MKLRTAMLIAFHEVSRDDRPTTAARFWLEVRATWACGGSLRMPCRQADRLHAVMATLRARLG